MSESAREQNASHETMPESHERWRGNKRYSELSPEERKKALCRSKSRVYLTRGKIRRAPCEVCGSEKAQMHHRDYDKPLEITWLCKNCHIVEHGEVVGRKLTCAHCDKPHVPGHALCRDHKNEYQRNCARARTAELHRLKAIAEGMK